jgi:hypothetical protein
MKRNELEIGKVYAYSRNQEPTSTYHISGFIVDSLEPVKDWRGNTKPEVRGRFTDHNGNPKETDPTNAPLRRLIGDYLSTRHDLELREKNREIAQLNKQIESTKMLNLIERHHETVTKRLEMNRYDIYNNYDGKATITFNTKQFDRLISAFQALDRHERHAQQQEAERLQAQYLESLEN